MKLKTTKLPDDLPGEVLIHHSEFGLMIAKWHGERRNPSYDAVGFRPGTHNGQAHPLAVIQLYPSEIVRIKGWIQLPDVDNDE